MTRSLINGYIGIGWLLNTWETGNWAQRNELCRLAMKMNLNWLLDCAGGQRIGPLFSLWPTSLQVPKRLWVCPPEQNKKNLSAKKKKSIHFFSSHTHERGLNQVVLGWHWDLYLSYTWAIPELVRCSEDCRRFSPSPGMHTSSQLPAYYSSLSRNKKHPETVKVGLHFW